MKYKEDEFLDKVRAYIDATYEGHYASKKDNIQTIDFIYSVIEDTGFLKGNAIKYLARFGKKEGNNPKDLFKAIHYIILLYYFTFENDKEEIDTSK